MNVALGVLLLWLGAALLWVAFHDSTDTTPWGAFSGVLGAIKGA